MIKPAKRRSHAGGEDSESVRQGADRSGMRETAGVMELQLGGLKLDNVDCLEPLALQVEVCHRTALNQNRLH